MSTLHAAEPKSEHQNGVSDHSRKVRIPWFPVYREVRHLLKIWPGYLKANVTGLYSAIRQISGTPQDPVDWTDPDTWIRKKLSGDIRMLAMAIWVESNQEVNPRHTYGHWLLVQRYDLLRGESDGKLQLTDQGRDFIEHSGGRTEIFLDQQEGLLELLAMIADSSPVRFGGLVDVWAEYLPEWYSITTIRDTLRRRLKNLIDRDLIDRERTYYSLTKEGEKYLKRTKTKILPEPDGIRGIRRLVKAREAKVREALLEYLLQMDPKIFEKLVGHLLEKMNYQNVEVVGQSGDGGVDVKAEIELGITSIIEVVQVKRHKRAVQRKDLDALRGSLYRFDAVRGTIVTTSHFTKGTMGAALEKGAAPITLIDGDKLIDLLIEHEIGIRKRAIEVLSIDLDGLSQVENSVEE